MARKRSRTALVSGGLEPVLDSGGGSHSVFAKAFLAALEDNDGVLEGQELFARVSRPVVVNSDQTPDYSDIRRAGHDGGEFLFVPLNINVAVTVETLAAPTATATPDASAFDLAFWQSIQNSDDPAMFETYLEQYPDGAFARIAKLKVEAAKTKQKQADVAAPPKPKETQTALVVPPAPRIEIDPKERQRA